MKNDYPNPPFSLLVCGSGREKIAIVIKEIEKNAMEIFHKINFALIAQCYVISWADIVVLHCTWMGDCLEKPSAVAFCFCPGGTSKTKLNLIIILRFIIISF